MAFAWKQEERGLSATRRPEGEQEEKEEENVRSGESSDTGEESNGGEAHGELVVEVEDEDDEEDRERGRETKTGRGLLSGVRKTGERERVCARGWPGEVAGESDLISRRAKCQTSSYKANDEYRK